MLDFPLWVQLVALVIMLAISAFFSIAETAMMALNRYRLKALVAQGSRGAILAAALLAKTDKLLGMILLGNTFVNAATTALITALAIHWFGNDETVLTIATGVVAFLILVFSEISPKVIGAANPEKIALPASFVLKPLLWFSAPVVWFVNLFVAAFLRLLGLRLNAGADETRLTPEELRSLVLEGGHFMPKKTHSILMNLFDLENVRVDDIMTPRSQVEGLDLSQSPDLFFRQLRTAHHTKLLVYEGEKNNVKGILHVRKAVGFVFDPNDDDEVTRAAVRELLTEPYYIPAATPVFQQLQFFQENRERFGVVVDEYGQLQGLVTLEDILEQLIGQFTSNAPIHAVERYQWVSDPAVVEGALVEGGAAPVAAPAYAVVEGASPLRELNRQLGLQLPLDGPKTLSGLIVEHLEDIPEAGVSLKIGPCVMEIIHTEDRVVKTVKLSRPIAETA